ncbi:electron transport complex subunit E [Wenzhouxiangella sp. AB-CW3]|uniref:electron transport complex subunit RsxE n=1 Tax=Wenzhouxiangella sp. AB-CW3 TaxID=2771012 RepID=UPI00168AF5FB|nr:electron transport complex subunit E [Wenzhouxiangella sp. AB-CW3]QOC21498.1 electron transport complex subunit E [Wenzhouxiangella sp. AB-CW3]
MSDGTTNIWRNGLWDNNPGLVQLLGLCPLLAVSNTTVNGLGLGLATMAVLVISSASVSLLRSALSAEIRIPAFVLIIATTVTAVDLVLQAWLHDLSRTLGIFVPLIVTNCTILARAEAFASRQPLTAAVHDGLAQGVGFAAVLVVLGAGRELVGHGTLLADLDLLLGDRFAGFAIQIMPFDSGLLIALLPPGAFIGLGLMVAVRQYLIQKPRPEPRMAAEQQEPAQS